MNTQDANGNYDRTVTTDASAAQAIPYKSVDPKISGGFTNIVNYKWFDLALTLTYSLGGYSFDKTGTYNETDGAKEQNYNLPIYELDRWQKPGDVTDVPRFVLGQAAGPQNSSRYVHSTDHLRVKNLTLGFTLPDQWLTKLGVSKARLYFSGSNLLTWAKWDQYDPEVPVSGEVFCETPPMLHCFERPSVLTGQYFQAMCLVVISSQNNFHVAASHRFCIFILNPTRIRGTEDSFLIPVHSLGFIFDNGLFQIAESYLRLQ